MQLATPRVLLVYFQPLSTLGENLRKNGKWKHQSCALLRNKALAGILQRVVE
jgi:hypothetical protein